MYTMILLLYFQQNLDVILDQASLRGEFRTQAECETAARKLRGPIPIPRTSLAAWQDVMCVRIADNARVNDMKPVELGKLLQQYPPLGCQAEGAWARVAEMCAGTAANHGKVGGGSEAENESGNRAPGNPQVAPADRPH